MLSCTALTDKGKCRNVRPRGPSRLCVDKKFHNLSFRCSPHCRPLVDTNVNYRPCVSLILVASRKHGHPPWWRALRVYREPLKGPGTDVSYKPSLLSQDPLVLWQWTGSVSSSCPGMGHTTAPWAGGSHREVRAGFWWLWTLVCGYLVNLAG